jgi:hypothetical protein
LYLRGSWEVGRQAGRPGVTFFSDFLQFVGGNKSLSGSQTPRAFGATRYHCTCKVLITRLSIDLTVNQGRRSNNKFKEVLQKKEGGCRRRKKEVLKEGKERRRRKHVLL